jgi:hypothetical protein
VLPVIAAAFKWHLFGLRLRVGGTKRNEEEGADSVNFVHSMRRSVCVAWLACGGKAMQMEGRKSGGRETKGEYGRAQLLHASVEP